MGSDLSRLLILMAIGESAGRDDGGSICRHLGLSRPFVSHQFTKLRIGGMITDRREGIRVYHRVTDE